MLEQSVVGIRQTGVFNKSLPLRSSELTVWQPRTLSNCKFATPDNERVEFMIKNLIFILITVIIFMGNYLSACDSKSGPTDINIKRITKKTENSLNNVIELSADYVIERIEENNRIISKMRSDLKPGIFGEKSDDKKFDVIFNAVKDMRSLYAQLSEEKDNVLELLENNIDIIDGFVDELNKALRHEESYLLNLKEELFSIDNNKEYDETDRKIKQNATQARIDLTKQRIEMLNNFIKNYSKIRPKLDEINTQVKKFIVIIVENAKFYDEAYKTLLLKKDLEIAYATINNITSLEIISKELINSRDDLKGILDTLDAILSV
jgi:hypothetical protein